MEVNYIPVTLNKNVHKFTPRKPLQGHAHFLNMGKIRTFDMKVVDCRDYIFTKMTTIEFLKDFPQSEVILL